jgi:hypothetical protein
MFITLTRPIRNPGLSADSKSQFKTTVILGRSRKKASIEIENPAVPSTAPKMAVTSETIWMPFIVGWGLYNALCHPVSGDPELGEAPLVSPRISRNTLFGKTNRQFWEAATGGKSARGYLRGAKAARKGGRLAGF